MRRAVLPDRLPEPRRILSWVYLGRISLAGGVFLAAVWAWTDAPASTTLAATLLLIGTAAFTFGSFLATHVRRAAVGRAFLYAQVVFDVILVTAAVHLTGGRESAFTPLYILVICAAAVLLPFLGGVLIGLFASLLFLVEAIWAGEPGPAPEAAVQVALFAVVALVTGYLGDRLRQTGTELGEVEKELHFLRLDTDDILGSINSGILTVDAGERLVFLNPAGEDLLGIRASAWLGRPVVAELDRVAPGLGAMVAETLRRRESLSRRETAELEGRPVLGMSTTLMERPPPASSSVTAIFQDITERRRIEGLRRRAERLEAVAELSASLAHEIKNPLASIRSAVEQLVGDGVDAEDRAVLSGLVVRESDRLSRLLTEFIDFARARVRAAEPVDLMATARNVVQLVRAHPHAEGRELALSLDPDETGLFVAGDEDLLHRALLNLALNAVQWAGEGGRAEVAVEAVPTDGLAPALGDSPRAVRVRVSDSGPGVQPGDRENVFDPFFTLRPGGTGLGLALVARAAEAHRGTVFVDEAAGWGSTFTMYLPALPVAESAGDAPEENAR